MSTNNVNFQNSSYSASFWTTQELWIARLKDILASSNVSPDAIIDAFCLNPFLKECYSKNAGVSEGYTIGEHTRMVLQAAQEFQSCLEENLQGIVSWNEFLLFLALHDIGKGSAFENTSAFQTGLSFKMNELKNSQEILKDTLLQLGIVPKKVAIFCSMLVYDTQGLYLKGEIHELEAFDNIIEMAHQCHLEPSAFYKLFGTFHMIDAVSYPSLRSLFETTHGSIKHCLTHHEKMVQLSLSFERAAKGRIHFDVCLNGVKNQEDPKKLQSYFFDHLEEILRFLEKRHKEMLQPNISSEEQEEYRYIKRGFRDLFLYFAQALQNFPEVKKQYCAVIETTLGNRDFTRGDADDNLVNFFDLNQIDAFHCSLLVQLEDALMNFRKAYLCRFSMAKVAAFIKTAIQKIRERNSHSEGLVESIQEEMKLSHHNPLSLLKITFIHGSNAAILPNLLKTGCQLMCYGRLARASITPFSGELAQGISMSGVNQYLISGTSLDDAKKAVKYSTDRTYQAIPSEEKKRITDFIKSTEDDMRSEKLIFNGPRDSLRFTLQGKGMRVSAAILRLRVLDPDFHHSQQEALKKIMQRLDRDWVSYQASDSYKWHMPKNADSDGRLGYKYQDGYWEGHFVDMTTTLAALNKALTDPIKAPQGLIESIQNPYALIFASNTVHTICKDVGNASERCSPKALQFGKDIQMIFLKQEHHAPLSQFLKDQGLEGKIHVFNMQKLESAILLNQLVSPYFADFASSKKMNCMVSTFSKKKD